MPGIIIKLFKLISIEACLKKFSCIQLFHKLTRMLDSWKSKHVYSKSIKTKSLENTRIFIKRVELILA